MASITQYIFRPGERSGEAIDLGGQGVDFKIHAADTEGRISIVEHPLAPGRLVPAHRHHNEDELSYVIEGELGVKIGDLETSTGPGTYVWKPRGVPHTCWNATSKWTRIMEIILPGGFEDFFKAKSALPEAQFAGRSTTPERRALSERFKLDFLPDWAPPLMQKYKLKLLGE